MDLANIVSVNMTGIPRLYPFLSTSASFQKLSCRFLDFCVDSGGYTGCAYRPDDVNAARMKMEVMRLNADASVAALPGVDTDQREDPGWRREE